MTIIGNIRHAMYEQVNDAILGALKKQPCMVIDIVREIDCSDRTVRNHLSNLEAAGRIKRTRMAREDGGGFVYVWSLPETPHKQRAGEAGRDNLVTALFGSARKEAA